MTKTISPSKPTTSRIGRVAVLASRGEGGDWLNLLTTVRHRNQAENCPWEDEVAESSWKSSTYSENQIALHVMNSNGNEINEFVTSLRSKKFIEVDGCKIHYRLDPTERNYPAIHDDCGSIPNVIASPFSSAASVSEFWCLDNQSKASAIKLLAATPKEAWKSLGLNLNDWVDRVGNVLIFSALDEVEVSVSTTRSGQVHIDVEAREDVNPSDYLVIVRAFTGDDPVLWKLSELRRGKTEIAVGDVDRVGYLLFNHRTGELAGGTDAFQIEQMHVQMNIQGPELRFQAKDGTHIHSVSPSNAEDIHVAAPDPGAIDSKIREFQYARRLSRAEAEARRTNNLVRVPPENFEEAAKVFSSYLHDAGKTTAPVYFADRYFLTQALTDHRQRAMLDWLEALSGRRFNILCTRDDGASALAPWLQSLPAALSRSLEIRTFTKSNDGRPAFHARYLVTEKREVMITHSVSGWNDSVEFAVTDYDVYRTEAKFLWSLPLGRGAEYEVRQIWRGVACS